MKLEGKALLVFGSRTLDDKRVEDEIDRFATAGGYKFIITALDPRGVCARARHYAQASRKGYVLMSQGLDQAHAKGMHNRRSVACLKLADHMLAIWDGTSAGTKGEIALAKRMKVPMTVVRMKPQPTAKAAVPGGEAFPLALFADAK